MSADERRAANEEMLFRYGDDHEYWDYVQWLADLVEQAFENIEGLAGAEVAKEPLQALARNIVRTESEAPLSWRDLLNDTLTVGTALPIAQRLGHALQYGLYGVTPSAVPAAQREAWVTDLVAEVVAFCERLDVASINGGNNQIVKVCHLARSRFAIDNCSGDVDVHSMSVLGGISEGRIRNLMSGNAGPLKRGADGGIEAMSALSWLMKRKGFLKSIWQNSDDETKEVESEELAPLENVIFVPVARDGSIFNPSLERNGLFQIGSKGQELNVSSFEEALTMLNAMPVPRWRRPNENGLWGIVSGVSWQRVEKKRI